MRDDFFDKQGVAAIVTHLHFISNFQEIRRYRIFDSRANSDFVGVGVFQTDFTFAQLPLLYWSGIRIKVAPLFEQPGPPISHPGQLTAFFNFIRSNIDDSFNNPCETPMIQKLFREKSSSRFDIIEKETMDEIIFRTTDIRNRLILELMARGGMRIGEVLKLTMSDIEDRKLILREPKSGKEFETVFIPQGVADRLRIYASKTCDKPADPIFPLSYETVRRMVMKFGKMAGIQLRPEDLRRHSATYASRSGVPIEIVSKVILRHANLSTTQRYLGTISDDEAKRWIEQIYR